MASRRSRQPGQADFSNRDVMSCLPGCKQGLGTYKAAGPARTQDIVLGRPDVAEPRCRRRRQGAGVHAAASNARSTAAVELLAALDLALPQLTPFVTTMLDDLPWVKHEPWRNQCLEAGETRIE